MSKHTGDLFGEALPLGPIDGLAVRLDRPCRHCGSTAGIVREGKAMHVAAVRCATCNQFCRWLGRLDQKSENPPTEEK
jgi:hypothetical protein